MVSFSVITPTICRPSLSRTVASILPQLGSHDEHIIVSDGEMEQWVTGFDHARLFSTARIGGYGAAQRDEGIRAARGDYLVFVDDDDVLADGALDMARPIVENNPTALLLFRCEFNGYNVFPDGTLLWRDPQIRDGNVSTSMIVAPKMANTPSWCKHGLRRYNCDLYWIMEMAAVTREVVWRTEVLQRTRPPS